MEYTPLRSNAAAYPHDNGIDRHCRQCCITTREGCDVRFIRALGATAALAITVALIGCTNPAVDRPAAQTTLTSRYESEVGKTMWVEHGLFACSKAGAGGQCAGLPAKTKFQIVGLAEGTISAAGATVSDGVPYYRLQLDDGRIVYATAPMIGITDIDPDVAAAECTRKGAPRIGMTFKQVEATCWGRPDHVNRRQTAGATSEQYVYGDGRFVYFHNGVVTSVQTRGTLR